MSRTLAKGEVWVEDVVSVQLLDDAGEPTTDVERGIVVLRLRDGREGATSRRMNLTPNEVAGLVDWWLKLGGKAREYKGAVNE